MLAKKNIVVIGGTSGLGLSAIKAFIKAGARVVSMGYDDDKTTVAAEYNLVTIYADARLENSAELAIGKCLETFGSFDGLYHVAGGSGRKFGDGPLHELTLEGWNKTLELNLTSLMLSNRAAVNSFLQQQKAGTILNLGSVLGFSPSPVYFTTHAYAAAKAAIIGFTKSIASYYAANNIRVNVIAPGLVDTPMAARAAGNEAIMKYISTKQPLQGGRIGNASDLDGAACYFMSDYADFTTGQVLYVDGGWSVSEGQY
jgi:NAD(P)-dependent dehydrogenase (short-subunit alcohol dehydrogenase family)